MKTSVKKTVTIMAVVSLLAAGSALAQRKDEGRDWPHHPPSAEQQLMRLSSALNLDSEQSVQLLVVLQEQAENRAALRQQVMELVGPEMCAQKADFEDSVLGILNEEQTEQFLSLQDERRDKRDDRRRGDMDCPQ
jgi:hypothetical protein